MKIFLCLLIVFMFINLLFFIWANMKNEIAYANRMRVMKAIYIYNRYRISNDEWIGFDAMEPYDDTLKRWWDWGCKRIVPPHTYEKIKKHL